MKYFRTESITWQFVSPQIFPYCVEKHFCWIWPYWLDWKRGFPCGNVFDQQFLWPKAELIIPLYFTIVSWPHNTHTQWLKSCNKTNGKKRRSSLYVFFWTRNTSQNKTFSRVKSGIFVQVENLLVLSKYDIDWNFFHVHCEQKKMRL